MNWRMHTHNLLFRWTSATNVVLCWHLLFSSTRGLLPEHPSGYAIGKDHELHNTMYVVTTACSAWGLPVRTSLRFGPGE